MKRLISIIAAIVLPLMALAQPDIKVKAPNLVGINEQFRITFEISGEDSPSDFSWNAGDDFQVVWGPQKGTSRSITSVNGKRTETSSTSYTYILLPKKTGKFQLDAASFTVKGKKYTTDRPNIEVVQDSDAGQQQVPDQPKSQQDMVSDDDIFMRLTLNKRNVILGEPVTATLKIYQRVNIAGFENARFPDFNGFWSQETNAPTNIEFQRENINDKIYNAALIRSWTLIPQQAGEIKIDPAELVCLINIRSQRAPTGSIFDSFFQDDYQTIRKRITTPAVTVKVSQLPAGAPASFGGGVGNYKMDVTLTRDSLMTHDAASLIVTVTGTGNVALLEAPKVNFPPDFEVYDAKTQDVSSGKRFEYPFIPRSHGDFVLDPVKYSYYDVNAGKYVTLASEALEIKVAKGNTDAAPVQSGQVISSNRKDVKNIGTDIRFISSSRPRLSRKAHFFAGSTTFWLIAAALSAIAAVIYLALRAGAKRRADVAGTKNRTATKMARKRLSQAGIFLKKGLHTAFYEELHKTVLGFVSDKLNMDISEMSKENIAARLKDNGVSDALAAEYLELLDSCEFARYAPAAGNEAMNTDYEKAVEVISAMDGSMGRKRKSSASTVAAVAVIMFSAHAASASAAVDVQADSLWQSGVEAYADGRWQDARQAWSGIEELGLESKELYYNIGNACFKQDDPAHAILYFERALRLDPSYDDARFNLEYANSMIQDKIESVPEFFLISWTRSLSMICPADTWAVMSLVMLALCLAMVLLFLLGHSSGLRKTGFGVAVASLLLALLCFSMASMQKKQYHKDDMAIVVSAVSPVKSSPGNDASRDLFVLHEGTKLKILDEVGKWKNVELSDGRQGWVLSSNLEII